MSMATVVVIQSDLDVLSTQAWQTLGQRDVTEEREPLAEAHRGSAAYAIALRALWMNCHDALEVALNTVRKELLFMSQKLEFTPIRQQFVCLCRGFHLGCMDLVDNAALVECASSGHSVCVLSSDCGKKSKLNLTALACRFWLATVRSTVRRGASVVTALDGADAFLPPGFKDHAEFSRISKLGVRIQRAEFLLGLPTGYYVCADELSRKRRLRRLRGGYRVPFVD